MSTRERESSLCCQSNGLITVERDAVVSFPPLSFFLLCSFPSPPLSHYTLRDKGAEVHESGCLQNCENPWLLFFFAVFHCHDFDGDHKRSIWNELEPTTWRQPNHKIKLWDYQNLGRKKKSSLPDMWATIFSPNPLPNLALSYFQKRGSKRCCGYDRLALGLLRHETPNTSHYEYVYV